MRNILLAGFIVCCTALVNAQIIADFEQILSLGDSVINGADGTDTVRSGAAAFPITYNPDFGGFWSGNWAISSVQNDSTSGAGNLYGNITGTGNRGSAAFAVGQQGAIIHLEGAATGKPVRGLYVTNTTYAHNSLRDGDMFAKQFGGEDGSDPDFFRLSVSGFLNGVPTTDSVTTYLADYRFEDDSLDYILDDWTFVDLQGLGPVDSLVFTLESSDVGDFGMNTPAFFAVDDVLLNDPSIQQGISADDPVLAAWATSIDVLRGPTDMSNPEADTVTSGDPQDVLGPYTPSGVSLGDGGMATLTFDQLLVDGEGADFVIFENGFPSGDGYFLELAFVEVSSDGETFVRFPATSLTDTSTQVGTFGLLRPGNLRNLAGRFPGTIGTPFDLAELRGAPRLNVDSISHVRVVDVVGSIDPAYASYDQDGRAINDPFPTDFASGGFDLTAVGAIHMQMSTGISNTLAVKPLAIYPNPVFDVVQVEIPTRVGNGILSIFDLRGCPGRNQ